VDSLGTAAVENAVKHRQWIARLMIENATALPNNQKSRKSESKTMEAETTSDAMDSVDITSMKEAINDSAAQVHYVQVLWDPKVNDHTQDSVKVRHVPEVSELMGKLTIFNFLGAAVAFRPGSNACYQRVGQQVPENLDSEK
jgi:hypothetical protein